MNLLLFPEKLAHSVILVLGIQQSDLTLLYTLATLNKMTHPRMVMTSEEGEVTSPSFILTLGMDRNILQIMQSSS